MGHGTGVAGRISRRDLDEKWEGLRQLRYEQGEKDQSGSNTLPKTAYHTDVDRG